MDDSQTPPPYPETSATLRPVNRRFFGSYSHSIDAKGRMIIPNAYREALGSTFTVGPTMDFRAVALYPEEAFDRILDELEAMNHRKPDVQKVIQHFYKLSYREMQADTQGRLLLPPRLRQQMLGDAKDLEISGCANHVRVMDAALAQTADDDFLDHRDAILERFGDLKPDE